MSILDTTIVNVALETLAAEFDAPLSTVQWVVTGYMLAMASVIPITGWAAERFGTKRIWIWSAVLFVAGSAACGLAWDINSLIIFRIIQGIGGGMIMPIGMMMVAKEAGPQHIGRVMSVIGIPMVLGPILGPVLGGFLVDGPGWRWIFFINVPIGLIALGLAYKLLPSDIGDKAKKLDWKGFALLSPGLALLVYSLAEIATHGEVTAILGILILVSLGMLGAFVRHALRHEAPLVELHLFQDKSFSAASIVSFTFGAVLFGAMILLPLYYQIVRGEDALTTGLLLVPMGAGAGLAMPFAGRLTDNRGAGPVVIVGVLILALSTVPLVFLGPNTSYLLLSAALFVRGIGMGFSMMPAMSAAYRTLKPTEVPKATTTINIIQRIGGALGTALLTVYLENQIPKGHLPGAARDLPDFAQRIVSDAFAATFVVVLIATLLALIPAIWLYRTQKKLPPPEPKREGEGPPTTEFEIETLG